LHLGTSQNHGRIIAFGYLQFVADPFASIVRIGSSRHCQRADPLGFGHPLSFFAGYSFGDAPI
jgi:hypothetical protein